MKLKNAYNDLILLNNLVYYDVKIDQNIDT